MAKVLPFLLVLAVWIYAFIDCLNTPEKEVRKLPKVMWVIIVLLFGQVLIGPIAWFAVGRPRRNRPYGATKADERRWVAPDDNVDFLRSLRDEPRGGSGADSAGPDAEPDSEKPDLSKGGAPKPGGDDKPAGRGGGRPAGGAGKSPSPEESLEAWEEEFRRNKDNNGPDDPTPPKP
ncbi:PLDc_N domain-containing protein [Streptomyces durbertensis]|uniref:PLDc_N domain-containing protein n=1 Tax=Streptomyces durbertensis TaxID=2448886 RepID=A0ABR6EFG4_9ACTN|nr:PLD nuclease N-terminal domain-containing protein [Streptomyces durbertensis]MBB1244071.1 PLDc_N domain-containing protein [Streptomyces durbertensis]